MDVAAIGEQMARHPFSDTQEDIEVLQDWEVYRETFLRR